MTCLQTLKTLVVKGLGAMCSIGAGLVAGKEGPFIQCGASIAWLLACGSNWLGGMLSRRQHGGRSSSAASSLGDSTAQQPLQKQNRHLQVLRN